MMFSPSKQSRSKTIKRNHSEFEQFSSGEINRMSVHEQQKRARKLAQDFVKSESNRSPSLTPQQPHGESIRFMDFLVQTTVDKHSKNPGVLAAAKKYSELPNTPTARANGLKDFEIECQPHIEQELTVNAGFELANATSNICNQMALLRKDTEFGRFAQGLGAMTQAAQGVYQISQASALMSQAANGAMTMASGAMMLGAVGAVISAGVMMYSLCSEEEDTGNGLGEALQAIHSAVMAMWEDTRRNFEIVFEKLDILDEKITEMERQNWKRFVAQMRAIHHYGESTRAQLSDLKSITQGHFQHLHDGMRSYLNELSDETAITMLDTIRLEGSEETIIHLSERIPQLAYWLNKKATIKDHTGRIDSPFGTLDIGAEVLIRELQRTMAPDAIQSLSLPLGLFASLAQHIDSSILQKDLLTQVINPEDWTKVLACYLSVIELGLPTISTLETAQQDAYLDIHRQIKEKPLLVLELLSNLTNSDKLWSQLINEYQQAVVHVQAQIANVLEEHRQQLNLAHDIDPGIEIIRLEQSANVNFERVMQQSLVEALSEQNPQALLKSIAVTVDNNLVLPTTRGALRASRLSMSSAEYLTDTQVEFLNAERFKSISHTPQYLVAKALELAKLDISCFVKNVGSDELYWDFTTHIVLSILMSDQKYPFLDINFFQEETMGNRLQDFNRTSADNFGAHWNPEARVLETVERTEVDMFYQLINNEVDIKILKPKRQEAAKDILARIAINRIDMASFECARLKLLSFIKLLNPNFEVDLHFTQKNVLDLIREIERGGEVEPLQRLLHPDLGTNLLQCDLGFPVTPNPSFSELADLVRTRINQQPLYQHRLWQTMAHAYASLEMLEQKLKQASLMQPTEQDKIEEILFDGMIILSKQHQRFSESLERMRSVMQQVQGLRLVSDRRLTEVIDMLGDLETQFAPRVDAAMDLNDDLNADYSAPEHNAAPAPLFTVPKEKRTSLAQRWMKRTKPTMGFSLSETVVLLEGVIQSFAALPTTAVPAVVLVGRSQVGKSTLANALNGVLYQSARDELGRRCVQKSEASTIDEFALVGQGQSSTTLFPNMRLSEDKICYWVDMPGYHENRGKAQQISTSIAFQCLQQHCQTMQGIVMVCDENELLSNGYATLRTTLENVGRMLPAFRDDAKAHVLLAVTHSRGEITQEGILSVLKRLLATEYSSVISADKRAVKRALLYLTQSIERISLVDVTNPESVAALTQKIKALSVSKMSEFNLTPTSDLIELFKKLMKTIVSAEHELKTRIEQLQAVLKHQFQSQLRSMDMEIAQDLVVCQDKLKTMLAHLNQDAHAESFVFTCLVEEQKALVEKATALVGTLSQLLNTKSNTTVISQGKVSVSEELLEKYAELEENQAFFSRMAEIEALLSDTCGYETDDEARVLLDEDTGCFLSDNGMTLIHDEYDADEDTSEASIWIKPDDTPGLRVLHPAYYALGKSAEFTRFFKDKGYTVTQVDDDVSVQLNITG